VSDELTDLRAAIDVNDRAIVAAVNQRLQLVAELWRLKRERSIDRLDRDRERELRAALAAANDGPLSAEGLDQLVDALLGLTKSELAD